MSRLLPLLLVLALPAVSRAESPWVSARGQLAERPSLSAFVGTRSAGVGVTTPRGEAAAWGSELVYSYVDRVVELRGAHAWRLAARGIATASVTLGLSGFVVPGTRLDTGVGPHAGLNLTLGGERFGVELGLQSGAEAFFDAPARMPQRALLGVRVQLGPVTVSALARAGLDLAPGHPFVFRGEAVLLVGWARQATSP